MVEHIYIETKNGLQVSTLVDRPKQQKSKSPVVILLHGTTGWKEEKHILTLARDLARVGILAVRIDAPGSGDSEGTWGQDYRISTYIDAVDDIYEYVCANYSVDPARVGIWGHSMGGQVAVQVGSRHPDRFSAVCGCQLSAGKMSGMLSVDGDSQIKTEIFGTVTLPKAYSDDRAQYVTAEAVGAFSVPQLYIAGIHDDIVPAAHVKDIYDHAVGEKVYREFPTDHMYKDDPENLIAVNLLTVDFFAKHLNQ